MTLKNPRNLYVMLLSDAREGIERSAIVFHEMLKVVQLADVKEALEARVFIIEKDLKLLDQCFELMGEKPVKLYGRFNDIFLEDFRRELAEIQSPVPQHLFILAKASQLMHLRMAEYVALIAAAGMTGHYGIGLLLESCMADKLAFVQRTASLIQNIVETKV